MVGRKKNLVPSGTAVANSLHLIWARGHGQQQTPNNCIVLCSWDAKLAVLINPKVNWITFCTERAFLPTKIAQTLIYITILKMLSQSRSKWWAKFNLMLNFGLLAPLWAALIWTIAVTSQYQCVFYCWLLSFYSKKKKEKKRENKVIQNRNVSTWKWVSHCCWPQQLCYSLSRAEKPSLLPFSKPSLYFQSRACFSYH